jgi:hypothetical protein
MIFKKLLISTLLFSNLILLAKPFVKEAKDDIYVREDKYDDVGGFLCACHETHYCVQIGVYSNTKNLNSVIKSLEKSSSIKFFTIERVSIKKQISQRLIAHSTEYYVSKKEVKPLLLSIQKKFKKAFILKRLYHQD